MPSENAIARTLNGQGSARSMAETTSQLQLVEIKVGDKAYEIDVRKFPYYQSLVDFQAKSGQDASREHSDIPLFDTAYQGVEKGFRQCFRQSLTELEQYHTLCETLDFLCVNVTGGRSLDAVIKELKTGKSDFEQEYGRYRELKNRSPARDAAFGLLYLILRSEFESEVGDSQKIYNAVFFVLSHRAIFKYRTRKIIRAAYEDRFRPSSKQISRLDAWPITEPGTNGVRAQDDVTTEESSSSSLSSWDGDSDCKKIR